MVSRVLHSLRHGSQYVERIGSEHSDLELLKAEARQRMTGGRTSSICAVRRAARQAPGRRMRVVSSRRETPWSMLSARAGDGLGFRLRPSGTSGSGRWF